MRSCGWILLRRTFLTIGTSSMVILFCNILSRIFFPRTPLRVSFAGGGTDLADFYERDFGAVFSTAIDQYVYVTVKSHSELNREPIRINYSSTELVETIDEI